MARNPSSGALTTRKSLSSGNRTATLTAMCRNGFSQHGDYVFGWKGDSLQRAMDSRCNGAVCSQLKVQSDADAMKCTKAPTVKEPVDGCKSPTVLTRSHRLYPLTTSQG